MIYLKTYFFDFFYSFSFLGHPGEHLPANTAFDHDNINLQVRAWLKLFLCLLFSQLFWLDNIKKYDFLKRDFLLSQLFCFRDWTPFQWQRRRATQSLWRRFVFFSYYFFLSFPILFFFSDEEEELAEAEQEDGQDVQEDVGEAEAAEEEGEVREVAQEGQEAGPLKRSLPSRKL